MARSIAIVRFDDPDAFIRELDRDRRLVDRRLVRMAFCRQPHREIAGIYYLSLVATARIGDDIYRLERCVGLWSPDPDACKEAAAKADALRAQLTETITALHLAVRDGIWEAPP